MADPELSAAKITNTKNVYVAGFKLSRDKYDPCLEPIPTESGENVHNAFHEAVSVLEKELILNDGISPLHDTGIPGLILFQADHVDYMNKYFEYSHYLLAFNKEAQEPANVIANWFKDFDRTDIEKAKKELEELVSKFRLNSDK